MTVNRAVFSFEEGVPDCFSTMGPAWLAIYDRHFLDGRFPMHWDHVYGSELTVSAPIGYGRGSRAWVHAESRPHRMNLTLQGTWELAETTDGARVLVSRHGGERTLLAFLCKDATDRVCSWSNRETAVLIKWGC